MEFEKFRVRKIIELFINESDDGIFNLLFVFFYPGLQIFYDSAKYQAIIEEIVRNTY